MKSRMEFDSSAFRKKNMAPERHRVTREHPDVWECSLCGAKYVDCARFWVLHVKVKHRKYYKQVFPPAKVKEE